VLIVSVGGSVGAAPLPHQSCISTLSKQASIFKSFWPAHHDPLLSIGLQTVQKEVHGHIIINPKPAKLQLQALELSCELRDGGKLP
jgi:hypothetical protein